MEDIRELLIEKRIYDRFPPLDGRGKAPNPKKISEDDRNFVKEHIQKFPKYRSRYSRKDNPNKTSYLTIKKMYELLLAVEDDARRREIETQQELHQRKEEKAVEAKRNPKLIAQQSENNGTIVICFDLGNNKAYMYMWDESIAPSGSSEHENAPKGKAKQPRRTSIPVYTGSIEKDTEDLDHTELLF
ncbi:hypothetical protein QE152_g35126 [Popillia japonica]|uniref:Uncharacterized protein n=1 Tax=Popillia japonica TaxID=7064 RepID=A0AAW1IRV1_POPJA